VIDLMDVLDSPDRESVKSDVDLLARMRTPGAHELLLAYEKLPPEARASLLGLLRSLTADEPTPLRRAEAA
jgi:hypothetical protein